MLNIYPTQATGSVAIWPATGSRTGANYKLELINDMNMNSSSFSLSLTNTPNNLSEYMQLDYLSGSAGIPSASGLYSYNLKADIAGGQLKWTEASNLWTAIQSQWTSVTTASGIFETIDSGRAFVYGTNDPEFTENITSNENGTYITYYS
jgi:hypothetical protein